MGSHRACRGLTLVELIFSLGLLALLAGLAAPGFQAGLRAGAVRSAAFALMSGVQQIRAHSILESRPGLLCPTDPAGQCLRPGTEASNWRTTLDGAPSPLAEQALPAGVALRASRSPLRFWPSSFSASTGTLTICDLHGIARPRAIVISAGGRARLGAADPGACA